MYPRGFLIQALIGGPVLKDVGFKAWASWKQVALAVLLIVFYSGIAWLARGESQWWYIDLVAGANVYWGDDSYRYFLARSAFLNADIYWFNFVLPVAVFLDGILTFFSNDNLLYARALKSLPLVASIFLAYFTCIRLGVRQRWAFTAGVLLASFPLYTLVSLSFYGESWLVFFISFALFLLANNKLLAAAFVIGFMPLIRGESIGFVAAFSLFALIRRDRRLLAAVLAPGALYLFLIIIIGPGVRDFLGWRLDVADIFEAVGIWYGGEIARVFDVLYWPSLLLAVPALFLKEARPIWPCAVGAAYIVARLVIAVELDRSSLEPRFLLGAVPVVTVGLALALNKLESLYGLLFGVGKKTLFYPCLALGFVGYLLFLHVSSIHVFKVLINYVEKNGVLPSSVDEASQKMRTNSTK